MTTVTEPGIDKTFENVEDMEQKNANTASDLTLDDDPENEKFPDQKEIEAGGRGSHSNNLLRPGTKPSTSATNKPSGVKNATSVKTSSSSTSKPTDASGATEPSDTSKPSSAKGGTR